MQDEQNINSQETPENASGQQPETSPETSAAAAAEPEVAAEGGAVGADDAPQAAAAEAVPHRKVRTGVVVSNKMQKSIVVIVERRVRHKLYKKYFNKTKKFMAHDENNECSVGDTVRIVETRPLSAHKRWRLDAILEKVK